jgi:hypothetical protein
MWVMQKPPKQRLVIARSCLFICHGPGSFQQSKTSVFQIPKTTVCRILPRFAISAIFHGRMFLPEAALMIAANRGIMRQIGSLERRFLH